MANLLLDPNLWRLVSLSDSPPAAWDGECYTENASRYIALRTLATYEGGLGVTPGDVVAGVVGTDPPDITMGSRVTKLVVAWLSVDGDLETLLYNAPIATGEAFSVPITPPVYLGAPTTSYLTVYLTIDFAGAEPDPPPYDVFEEQVTSWFCATPEAVDVCYPPQCGCSLPAC